MNEYTSLIDVVVVLGAAAVLPLALDRGRATWAAVAVSTAVALSVGPGLLSAALALPWLAAAAAATSRALAALLRSGSRNLDGIAAAAVPAFALVAGVALVDSCAGAGWLSVGEPIARLTVVHFTYAGAATTALGLAALRSAAGAGAPTWRHRAAAAGTTTAMAAPPIVALGFLSGAAVAQVGGAVVMSAAAYLIAASHVAEAWPGRATPAGRLLLVSGLSVWLPMVLAVAWALAQHTGGPALSIPDMARVHGSLNAFGFVGCGLAARHMCDEMSASIGRSADPPGSGPSDSEAISLPAVVR